MTRSARAALLLGVLVGCAGALLAGDAATASWRALALPVALGAVMAGIVELVALARGEWRRERPPRLRYLCVAVLFVTAFLLTVIATA
jgi:hypothetical protein